MENQYLIDKNRYDKDVKNGILPEKISIEKQVWESTLHRSMVLQAENEQHMELLKECKHIMSIEKDFASCHFEKDKLCKLLTKISQVLGEE